MDSKLVEALVTEIDRCLYSGLTMGGHWLELVKAQLVAGLVPVSEVQEVPVEVPVSDKE